MRRIGKTTRIVDKAIQALFYKGEVLLYEDPRKKYSKESTMTAFKIFKKRMESEHPHVKYTYDFQEFKGVYFAKIEIIKR